MTPSEIVAAEAERLLPLSTVELGDEYYYQSLPLCVIDAVFSIGVRYEGVRRVVMRHCEKTAQRRVRLGRGAPPARCEQEPTPSFCVRFETLGIDTMTSEYFMNRQRTSTASGILKSEAVYRFAAVLRDFGVEHLQDVSTVSKNAAFEKAIRSIPGQRSGISLQYFWMLAGSDEFIKPDRMVIRFLQSAVGREVGLDEASELLRGASDQLKSKHPALSPRLLDHAVWLYQRAVAGSV